MEVCHLSLNNSFFYNRIFQKECESLIDWAESVTIISPSGLPLLGDYPGVHNLFFPPDLGLKDKLARIRSMAVTAQSDIYHIHDPELLLLVPSLRKHTDGTIIYNVHTPQPEFIRTFSTEAGIRRYLHSYLAGIEERTFLGHLDGVIFSSTSLYDSMSSSCRFSTIIYNFPQLEHFPAPTFKPQEIFSVVYKGVISNPHGILHLIEAFYHFYRMEQHGRLRIIGNIYPPEFQSVLQDAIRYFSLSHAVSLEPTPTRDEIAHHLETASVGISALLPLPYFQKHVESNIFEYMASGVPVICGNFPSSYRFVRSQKTGIVLEQNTPPMLAEALSFLYNHQTERRKMGQRGNRMIRDKWHWQSMKSELRRFYTTVYEWRQSFIH